MATFTAALSAQITERQKADIGDLLRQDQERGRVSEADVIRAALALGLPALARKSQADRLRLYASITRS